MAQAHFSHRSCAVAGVARRLALVALVFVAFTVTLLSAPFFSLVGYAQQQSYWLRSENGSPLIGSCPGNPDGEPIRATNRDGQWVLIWGVVVCRDTGAAYSFELSYLAVQINTVRRGSIERPMLNFDWVGLAVYKPRGNGEFIDWLYDEALPVRGSLAPGSTDTIYFGNLKFDVPKAQIDQATNFVFYLTAEGVPFTFGLL